MKAPSSRSILLGLALSLVILSGVLASLPLATWLWWAVPPLELYYMDAYFHASTARRDPTALMSVEWVYKSAPNRPDEIANASDVVAEGPGMVSNYQLPMHISTEARKAGWSALIRGSNQKVRAAELEPYLQSQFYGGRNFWELLEPPVWGALLMLIVGFGIRD